MKSKIIALILCLAYQMSKAEIIENLSTKSNIRRAAQNIAGSQGLGNDLYQHLFLVLCNYDEQKLLEAHQRNQSDFLCIRILFNSFHQRRGEFATTYRHQQEGELPVEEDYAIWETPGGVEILLQSKQVPIFDPEEEGERIALMHARESQIKPIEKYLEQPITQENYSRITLLKLWANGESYRKIEKRTGVKLRYIMTEICKAKAEIKQSCSTS